MSASRHHRVTYSQNFLRNPRLVECLLDRSGLASRDLVIEIGPGRGALTSPLAARCREVIAVEKDAALAAALRHKVAACPNVTLFAADFLHFPLPLTAYKVFANIPFNITAAIVGKLTSGASPPVDAYLAMQREAAERFLGTPRETLAAALLHPWFEPAIVHRFRASDFSPPPGVEVVLLRLQQRDTPLVAAADAGFYRDLVTFVFTAWRPTVREALAPILPRSGLAALERTAGVSLACPPSALPCRQWPALTAACRDIAGDRIAAVQGASGRLQRQQSGLRKLHRTRTPRRS